mmetsp:Transcript_15483/g.18874  ORF Transcript_15483/g.18874 Transcript_15483/m.18874 type:complete len:94 (+) Transcript_15483:154-435(+)
MKYTQANLIETQRNNSEKIQACSPAQTYQNRRGSTITNPVVTAMLSSNNLGDCVQVEDLLRHCLKNDSRASICDTAAKYFETCSIMVSGNGSL